METKNRKEFDKLIGKVTCDTGNDLDVIGFTAEGRKSYLGFWDDNGKLEYNFSLLKKGQWVDYDLGNLEQDQLREVVRNKVNEINDNQRVESMDDEDPYHPYQYAI